MDVFDIHMPAPELLPALTRVPAREFVWGTATTDEHLWNGEPLGKLQPARLSANRLARLPARFAAQLRTWKTLRINWEAQQSYRRHLLGNEGPTLDLEGILLTILRGQPDWLVWCEHDCDQYPVEYAPREPAEVATCVRSLTLSGADAESFVAWPAQPRR